MSASMSGIPLEAASSLTDTSTLMRGKASLLASLAVECAMFGTVVFVAVIRCAVEGSTT